jgi:hypothetical protein
MGSADREDCVLIFAPIGRDAPASAELLHYVGVEALICPDLGALVSEISAGVGVVFLAEEGLFAKDTEPLAQWIDRQPAWSDLPFIVLTSHQEQPAVVAWRRGLVRTLRNVSLLERPVQPITLASAVQSALRARRRQYEVRALIRTREETAQELKGWSFSEHMRSRKPMSSSASRWRSAHVSRKRSARPRKWRPSVS